jgi:glutamate-1-semialdehyde 2,1-aminomutase
MEFKLPIHNKNIPFKIHAIGSIFWIAFSNDNIKTAEAIDGDSMKHFRLLHAALLENGVYLGPSGYEVGFIGEAHTQQDIEKTIAAFAKAFEVLA